MRCIKKHHVERIPEDPSSKSHVAHLALWAALQAPTCMVALFAKLRKWSNLKRAWTKWQQLNQIADRNKIHSHYNSYQPPYIALRGKRKKKWKKEEKNNKSRTTHIKYWRNNMAKQLQSSTVGCWSAMNAFLWALDKLNFPLGKEHICWLRLLSLRILIRLSCKAKQHPLNFSSS